MKREANNISKPQILVTMLGARTHYAVPVLLDQAGMLAHLYTDVYVRSGWLKLAPFVPPTILPRAIKRLLGRQCEIPDSKVTAFNRLGLLYRLRLSRLKSASDRTIVYRWVGEMFDRLAIRFGLHCAAGVYSINHYSSLLFQACRSVGIKCILEQMNEPMKVHDAIMAQERESWLGWEEDSTFRNDSVLYEQEAKEWESSDTILVPSHYVGRLMAKQDVPSYKCRVLPYGLDLSQWKPIEKPRSQSRLRVLFVGGVGLRKGVPYLLNAARRLVDRVELRIVGPIKCNEEAFHAAMPINTDYIGQVPSMEIHRHFEWADVLCLPSLTDSFGMVCLEALALGIPVIATPNTGASEIVRDGREGFVVPIRNSDAIAEKLASLARDRDLLYEMSRNARTKAQDYSWTRYGERLMDVIFGTLHADSSDKTVPMSGSQEHEKRIQEAL